MIQATIRMMIPPRKRDEILGILRPVVEQCRDEPGCTSCHLYGDLQDRDVILLEQVWKTTEGLDRHLGSEEFRNLLLIMELALERPEIRFNTISSSSGMETIERARAGAR